ncbi:unnamed protein product, partial [Rotaria sp. Silwood1]
KRLNKSEKINYIRQYACLIHRLFYVQLRESQWNMHQTYGRSKTLIVQRLTTLQRQLQEASQALQEFGNQPLPQYLSEMNHPLNFTTMSPMVTAVVGKGQHK